VCGECQRSEEPRRIERGASPRTNIDAAERIGFETTDKRKKNAEIEETASWSSKDGGVIIKLWRGEVESEGSIVVRLWSR
jgi:hypothetical protein